MGNERLLKIFSDIKQTTDLFCHIAEQLMNVLCLHCHFETIAHGTCTECQSVKYKKNTDSNIYCQYS